LAARVLLPAVAILGWLVVGGIGGPYAGKLSEVARTDNTSFLPASAESTAVSELLPRFGGEGAGVPAIVVAERGGGMPLTAVDRGFLDDLRGQGATPLITSPDGGAAQFVVPVAGEPDAAVEALRQQADSDRPGGLEVYVTGPAGQAADLGEAFGGIDGLLLLVAGAVVAVILLVVYRSPLLPLMVLVSAVLALGLASLVVYLLADADVLALNGQSQGILFILVFGAATDYALLLVARYREQLADGHDRFSAMRRAWRATVEPVGASAGTVILGVLCLLLSDLNSNKGLGPVAAIGVGAALLASMTFLPFVLAVAGRAAFWPFRPTTSRGRAGVWNRIARFVDGRPRAIWIGSALVLAVGAGFIGQLQASGTAQSDVFLTEVDSVAGQEALGRHFPGGTGAPTIVMTNAADARSVVSVVGGVDGVASVRPAGTAGELVRIDAVLEPPPDSEQAIGIVRDIRAALTDRPGVDAEVGGETAVLLDTQDTSQRDRTVIIPVVLVVVLGVLCLLLRSILAPLLLVGTVVLSFAATMGVSALVFNHVLGFPGADPVVPLFGFVFLVALGIDYNIFLMTRAREEAFTLGTRDGTLRALTVTGGVITSAGVVLAATFAALAVLPILFLAQLAFIVAFGVLLDTLLVRSLLVPALAVDIGRRIWWPSRLARSSRPVR